MALVEVKVPDIGDFKDVEIIELLVKPGDTVKAEQSLITVESDKASMEIPSSHAGVVKELKGKVGDKVGEGSAVLMLETEGAAAPAATPAPTSVRAEPVEAPPQPSAGPSTSSGLTGGGGPVEVVVPDIGDFDEVAVIEVFIKPGDTIKTEQSLVTVESDKASMEIPSSHAGVVKDIKVKVGDKVKKGSVLALVESAGGAAPTSAPPASTSTSSVRTEAAPAPAPAAAPAAMPVLAPPPFALSLSKWLREGREVGRSEGHPSELQ